MTNVYSILALIVVSWNGQAYRGILISRTVNCF